MLLLASARLMPDWNPIGPRFSNGVLQALVVLFGKRPPKVRLSPCAFFPHDATLARKWTGMR